VSTATHPQEPVRNVESVAECQCQAAIAGAQLPAQLIHSAVQQLDSRRGKRACKAAGSIRQLSGTATQQGQRAPNPQFKPACLAFSSFLAPALSPADR
jgi:hypothetical protein